MGVRVGLRRQRRSWARLALAVGAPALLLLALSQVVLPRLAAQRIRDQLEPYGELQSVSVSAFPALELLWGKADFASATAQRLTLDEAQAMKLTWEGRGVREANVSVGTLTLRVPGLPAGIMLQDMVSRKHGPRIATEATLTEADLGSASSSGFEVRPLESGSDFVRIRASGSLFGMQASVDALVAAREGKLIAQPIGIPFGQFLQLTLFSDPHVYLDSIAVTPQEGGQEASWRLAMHAHLR